MAEISELLGALKGIGYDEEYNRREIDYIKNLVEEKRKIIFDDEDRKTLKIIEDILEDNYIDCNEKKILKDIYEDHALNYSRNRKCNLEGTIYNEFYGIVNGVLSDGDVNSVEIKKLNEYIDLNFNYLKKYDYIVNIQHIINNNYEHMDNNTLIEKIRNEICKYRHSLKLDKLRNMIKKNQLIGLELIKMIDDEAFIEYVHSKCQNIISRYVNSFSVSANEFDIVLISVSFIALLNYEKNFYSFIEDTYINLYNENNSVKLNSVIRETLRKYNKKNGFNTKRPINGALINTIVPKNFLSNFFEFIFDIYKVNFNYSVPMNIEDEFRFVYEGIRSKIDYNTENFSFEQIVLGDSNIEKNQYMPSNKSYKLIKSTKEIIQKDMYLDYIISFSSIVLNIINDYVIHKNKLPDNSYFKDGFENWLNNLDCKEKLIFLNNHNRFKNRHEPRYILKDNNIILVFPIHKLNSSIDYKKLRIELTIGKNKYIYSDELKVKTIFGGFSLELDEKIITENIDNIRYRLIEEKENGSLIVIYDSKDRLKRKYLVFGSDGEELKNNQKYSGSASIVSSKKGYDIDNILKVGDYYISNIDVNEDDIIEIENSYFSFGEDNKVKIIGDLLEDTYIEYIDENKKIDVYRSIDKIIVSVHPENVRVIFDGREINSINKIEIKELKSGIHKLVIKHSPTSEEVIEFVLDEGFNYLLCDDDNSNRLIRLESSLINHSVEKSLSYESFSENWSLFKYRGKNLKYIIPLEYNLYNINNKWKNICDNLYIDELYDAKGKIKVYGSSIKELRVYDEFGKRVIDIITFNKKSDYNIVNLKDIFKIKRNVKYFRLEFSDYNNGKFGFNIFNQCIIDDEMIFEYDDNNELTMLCAYEGEGSVYLRVLDQRGCEVYFSEEIEKYMQITGIKLIPFEEYTFEFIQENNREYEFNKKVENIIVQSNSNIDSNLNMIYGNNESAKKSYIHNKGIVVKSFKKIFFNYESLIDKKYKIDKLMIQYFGANTYMEKNHNLRNTYINITGPHSIEKNSYYGEIIIDTNYNKFRLDNIGRVIVELCSEEYNGNIELSIITEGEDGLLFYEDRKQIYNGLEHKDLNDIYSYTINISSKVN